MQSLSAHLPRHGAALAPGGGQRQYPRDSVGVRHAAISRAHCRRRQALRAAAEAGRVASSQQQCLAVTAEVEKTSWSSRKLYASVAINAPVHVVWSCLTDYEGLGTFIPSLVRNECLQRKSNGAVLLQVGAQEVAMGLKFSAACTLDCTEYPQGVPAELCSTSGDGTDGLLPWPRNSQQGVHSKDITFVSLQGDFQAFRGVWRMQPNNSGSPSSQQGGQQGSGTLLCYSLYVQPQSWLPVGIVQGRIADEIVKNLMAVQTHAEMLAAASQGSQQAESRLQGLDSLPELGS